MNTTKTSALATILRTLSVVFISFGVYVIAICLSSTLGTIRGVHSSYDWPGFTRLAAMLVLVGALQLCGYRFSLQDNRGSLATTLLWFLVLATEIYAAIFLGGMFQTMVCH